MAFDEHAPMDELSAHLDRGWDLVQRGELAAARIAAEQGLTLDEESPEAHNLMGYVLAAEGHVEEALEHYRRAIEVDETFLEAMLNVAELLLGSLGRPQEALEVLEDALELCETDDERADTMLAMVEALLQMGRPEEADAVVAQLPEGPFESPELEAQVGRVHLDRGHFEAAEKHLRRALERAPMLADAQYYLGLVQRMVGHDLEAMVSMLRARELDAQGPSWPWSQPREQFEAVVADALRKLPEEVSKRLDGAAIVVTDLPGAEVVSEGVDPRVPVMVDRVDDEGLVGKLFVYQRNIERYANGRADVPDVLLEAVTDEVTAAAEDLEDAEDLLDDSMSER